MDEAQQLKAAGLKITAPRIKVLQILQHTDARHVSAEEVYQALHDMGEDVGLATVYRVLTQFESAGLISRHHFESGHSVFELKQGEHHDHLVCLACGRVDEFCDDVIEERQRRIAEKARFVMAYHALNIYGTCSDCSDSGLTPIVNR